ncbi:MAG: lysophospholipid acyltransferase family protein [Candidatus Binatia bacterium]
MTRTFARLLCKILNIQIAVEGEQDRLESGGNFIVSNHLGYVDGMVLGSLFPVIYVAKKEVRGWPLIGQWTALCGTVFVDRQRKDRIPLLVEEIAKKLRQNANVLIFPEGTSTNGESLLPFQSAPFAAALRARAPVAPVTLTYRGVDHRPLSSANRDLVYWYGDMEFVSHFWNLLALQSIEVSVKIRPEIETSLYRNSSLGRKQLSQACHDSVSGRMEETERRRVLP